MGQGGGQGAVLTRLDREPLLPFSGGGGEAGIDGDDGAAVKDIAELRYGVGHLAVGGERVAPPDHQALGLGKIVVAVTEESLGVARAHLLRLGADGAVRVAVGGAENLAHGAVQEIRGGRRVPPAHVHELVRLVRPAQIHHLVGDGVQRLVPADRHELGIDAAPLGGVGALHRHLDAVGIVGLLDHHMAAGADISAVGLGELVAADLDDTATLYEELHRAPGGTPLAGGGDPFALAGAGCGRGVPCCKGVQLRQADGRHRSGCSGYLQKISTLDFHSVPPIFCGTWRKRPSQKTPSCRCGRRRRTYPSASASC